MRHVYEIEKKFSQIKVIRFKGDVFWLRCFFLDGSAKSYKGHLHFFKMKLYDFFT